MTHPHRITGPQLDKLIQVASQGTERVVLQAEDGSRAVLVAVEDAALLDAVEEAAAAADLEDLEARGLLDAPGKPLDQLIAEEGW